MKNLLLITCYFIYTLPSYAQKELWGITSEGGQNRAGVIFKTDGSGNNYNVEHAIFRFDGDYPKADLLKASDGKFYGMTSACCVYDGQSVLFQYDPATSTYVKKVGFTDLKNGTKPYGSLIEVSGGKLYGMTNFGGANNAGVIFQYDLATSTYTKRFDFDGTTYGSGPQGSLMQTPDGKLYGMTFKGGANNYGVLFQYDPVANTVSKRFDFDGALNGSGPLGSLVRVANGMLYGMTNSGGVNDFGVLFQYDPDKNIFSKMFDFDGAANGGSPSGSLTVATDGKLYGMTTYGGKLDNGVLFEYDPSASTSPYTKRFDFDTVNGSYPMASLFQAADKKFYGMTRGGGVNDGGVIFQYDPSAKTCTSKFNFNVITGLHPQGSLIQDSNDGTFYGLTYDGGVNGVGTLFQYNPATFQYNKKFDFHFSFSGSFPTGALMQASDGTLYGAARDGGANNAGAIFQYDRNTGTYTNKFDFDKATSGRSPSGSFVQTADKKIYGMTTFGGSMDKGVLFEYDPASSGAKYKKLFDFDGIGQAGKGSNPMGTLLIATDGKLYGMTQFGGANDFGVIFQYDITKSNYTKIFDFDGTNHGKYPEGSLIQTVDGKIYGMTSEGGANDFGVLFQYDPTGATVIINNKIDFNGIDGSYPRGSLMQASDNMLYGMTSEGGKDFSPGNTNGLGVIFQFNPANSEYKKKIDFDDSVKGSAPNGSLLQASDGKLYGATPQGGKNSMGVLFQFDPSNSDFATKIDFDGQNGRNPGHISLIEIASTNSIFDPGSQAKEIHVYPNPGNGKITVVLDQKVVNASLKLFTLTGQMILSKENFSGDKLHLNISEQADGIYFMEVTENGAISRVKIVKD